MTNNENKICERCKTRNVTNGTSLCNKCYDDHNEIFGISNEFNSQKYNDENTGISIFYTIAMISVMLFVLWTIFPGQIKTEIKTIIEEKIDYESFPQYPFIYEIPDYNNSKTILPNNHGYIEIIGSSEYGQLVKIIESNTKKIIYELFIYPNDTISVAVLNGDYEIFVAKGKRWLDEFEHFGSSTIYFKLDKVYNVYTRNNEYITWTINLEPRQGGNLSFKNIDKSEW